MVWKRSSRPTAWSDATTDSRVEPETIASGMRLRQHLVVILFLVLGHQRGRHVQSLFAVQRLDDDDRGNAAPAVELIFGEGAAPLAQRPLPGDQVQRHGVDDGAVAVEEVGFEIAGREL
jgi:hypothetical protein